MKLNITALFSLTIAASVLLSGIHAKDLPALSSRSTAHHQANTKKAAGDDSGASPHGKVTGEVHNHIEKQTLKSALKVFGDQNMQADARHLKRQRHHAKKTTSMRRLRGVLSLVSRRTAVLLSA